MRFMPKETVAMYGRQLNGANIGLLGGRRSFEFANQVRVTAILIPMYKSLRAYAERTHSTAIITALREGEQVKLSNGVWTPNDRTPEVYL
jgi:hypothetical protein